MIVGIAALVLMLFGGGARLDALEKAIKNHVEDSTRVERAQEIIEDVRAAIAAEKSQILDIRKDITALDERHDATVEEYRKQFDRLNRAWTELDQKLLDARFRLKQVLTREEWNAVFAQAQLKS
jgi:predicted  nucleic acid-binding Zn-ribbon protein